VEANGEGNVLPLLWQYHPLEGHKRDRIIKTTTSRKSSPGRERI